MKIVSQNHAADIGRFDEIDSSERLMLDAIAYDLRSLYGADGTDLPDDLLALAGRLEIAQPPDVRAA